MRSLSLYCFVCQVKVANMNFSWQSVVSQFEIEYDTFCMQDREENIYMDYAGVNAEGSSPNTHLRRSWAHLVLLDAILAYTEHKTRTAEMTQSLDFQYHKTLRKCIQISKKSHTLQNQHDDNLIVNIPSNWASTTALQQSLYLEDNTVCDIYEFLVSSPLLEDEGDMVKLITDMVKDIPAHDPHQTSTTQSSMGPSGTHIGVPSTTLVPPSTKPLPDRPSPPSTLPPPSFMPVPFVQTHDNQQASSSSHPNSKNEVLAWGAIVSEFTNKCEKFLYQGHNKIMSDICDVSTHCSGANVQEWVDLLLLDAILCVLMRVATKKRTSTCFNQHRVLRECVQSFPLNSTPYYHQPSEASARRPHLDIRNTTVTVAEPWNNVLNFSDQYCKGDVIVDPVILKKNARKMSFKREQARIRAGQKLCGSHVFNHMSLKCAIESVSLIFHYDNICLRFSKCNDTYHVISCYS